jgi:hypothetical protein
MRYAELAACTLVAAACMPPSYGVILEAGADDTTDTDTDTDTGEPPIEWHGEPLPLAEPGEWLWVDFPENTRCRSGEPTGIGVRYADSDDLLIYFQGGGACFHSLACLTNPQTADAAEFYGAWAPGLGRSGIFNDDHPANPAADFNVVYVPYCSGDVFAGDREDVELEGLDPQQFVGYRNVTAFLDRVVPTFRGAPQVLIVGASAGGFGASFNAIRIARSFPESQVTLVNDSAPLFSDDYVAPCLQQRWRDVWGLDDTIPAGCDACFNPDGGGLSNLFDHISAALPKVNLGLISATRDATISIFYAFGVDACSGFGIFTGDQFQAGLYELRERVLAPNGWGSYFIPANTHVWTQNSDFYNTEVAGAPLTDWLADLMAGDAAQVAP